MTDSATREGAPAGAARSSTLTRAIDVVGWTRIRRGALLIYFLALVVVIATVGVPIGRNEIALLSVLPLVITRLGAGWRALGQVLIDWAPFTAVLIFYDKTRGAADAVGLPLHEADVVGWERALFGGQVPTVWLQHHLYDPHHVYWYDALFTLVYTSHFLATPAVAAVLWLRHRLLWVQYISRVILLSVAGLITYILFPEAPPWLAARDGIIADPIARLSARGWIWLHAPNLQNTLAHAQEDGSNPVAAMPSLHIAFACLIALYLGGKLTSRWRYLLSLYPVAMGLTLVYTGEHYVVDLIAGVVYAVAAHLAVRWWEGRRAERSRTEIG